MVTKNEARTPTLRKRSSSAGTPSRRPVWVSTSTRIEMRRASPPAGAGAGGSGMLLRLFHEPVHGPLETFAQADLRGHLEDLLHPGGVRHAARDVLVRRAVDLFLRDVL